MTWQVVFQNERLKVENLDGVAWYEADVPLPTHHHLAQTRAWRDGNYVERCACGAKRFGTDPLDVTGRAWIGTTRA